MPLRLARYSDINAVARIYAAAFHEEEYNGDLLNPYRLQYPDDYVEFWRRKCRERHWDYRRVCVVSFIEKTSPNGQKQEVLTGSAIWTRTGLGWMKVWGLLGWWDPRRLILPFMVFVNKISNIFWPNRAASKLPDVCPSAMDALVERYVVPFYAEHPERQTVWDLSILAVLSEHREFGHGRELVAWGLARAKQEKLLSGVISAVGREQFYQRCGYTNLVGWATEGEGNPLRKHGIKGGAIMFTPAVAKVDEDKDK